jgi:hypothetical protein
MSLTAGEASYEFIVVGILAFDDFCNPFLHVQASVGASEKESGNPKS